MEGSPFECTAAQMAAWEAAADTGGVNLQSTQQQHAALHEVLNSAELEELEARFLLESRCVPDKSRQERPSFEALCSILTWKLRPSFGH